MNNNSSNKFRISHNRDHNLETVGHCHTDRRPCLFPVRKINKNHDR